jgi:TRAP-type C4-dicarboxylate transport system permease small subunit
MILNRCDKALSSVEFVVTRITSYAMLFIMCSIFVDVLGRYILSRPLSWLYDLTSMYFINMVLYLFASEVFRTRSHISLELEYRIVPEQVLWLLELLAWIAVAITLIVSSYILTVGAFESYMAGEMMPGIYNWRVWVEKGIVALGLILLSLRVIIDTLKAVAERRSFYRGEEFKAL